MFNDELPSMASGCIRDIRVPNPSGGEAVQIGCPADLSGNPCRNDGVLGQTENCRALRTFL
ncbi:MAG: hypothetical protein DM484_08285 [Candidatus Methylumidiphilus alinenensis]|uniref:Uncharacterized protein n=1 Tax=Candidatus Methylumidiphilus alinenensis TaxID=2202197 RepID=A0A2W4RBX4_9GAMM|nr:MAG: hypothetical protein DM484_08285 [Candidatus Methylumidiphilus alinenensis]